MTRCDLDTSVPGRVIEHPATLAAFRELGIDYFCGGKSLAYACRERGMDAEVVLSELLRRLDDERQIRRVRFQQGVGRWQLRIHSRARSSTFALWERC